VIGPLSPFGVSIAQSFNSKLSQGDAFASRPKCKATFSASVNSASVSTGCSTITGTRSFTTNFLPNNLITLFTILVLNTLSVVVVTGGVNKPSGRVGINSTSDFRKIYNLRIKKSSKVYRNIRDINTVIVNTRIVR